MNDKSARGISAIFLLLLVVIIGALYYFYSGRSNIPEDILISKLSTTLNNFCASPNKGKFLGELKERIICGTDNPLEDVNILIPSSVNNNDETKPSYVSCDSVTQTCVVCWGDQKTGKRVCCKKFLADNVPGKNKCTLTDAQVDSSTIPD